MSYEGITAKTTGTKSRWQFKYEMYRHLALTQAEFFDKVRKIRPLVRFLNSIGKVGWLDNIVFAVPGSGFDDFLKLRKISWPLVSLQKRSSFVAQANRVFAESL